MLFTSERQAGPASSVQALINTINRNVTDRTEKFIG